MLKYSPLCDTSYSAYIAYLLANISDVDRHEYLVSVFRGEGWRKLDGGRADAGGHVGFVDSGCVGSVEVDAVVGVCDDCDQARFDGDDGCGVGDACAGVADTKRIAGDFFSGDSSSSVDLGGHGVFQQPGSVEVLETSVGETGASGATVALEGSQKLSKNARKRRNQRARGVGGKRKGVSSLTSNSVPAWRVAAAPVGGFTGVSHKDVTSLDEQKVFAREWYERKTVENKLAIKEAELKLKMYEQNASSGFDEKKVTAWRMGIEHRIRTLSDKSSSRGDSAASSVPSGSYNPPSSVTSVSERERVLEKRCEELSAFKARVEGGQFGEMSKKVKYLEAKLSEAETELEGMRQLCINEQRARARDIEHLRRVF